MLQQLELFANLVFYFKKVNKGEPDFISLLKGSDHVLPTALQPGVLIAIHVLQKVGRAKVPMVIVIRNWQKVKNCRQTCTFH